MNIFRNRLGQSGSSESGTVVYINGVKSRASRVDLDEIIPMPYVQIPSESYEPQCVIFNNELHLVGGNNLENYKSHIKWNGTSWENVSTLPDNICGIAIADENHIYILSSYGSSTHYVYAWDGTQWTQYGSFGANPKYGRMVIYNNEFHLLSEDSLIKFTDTNWTRLTNVPYSRGESTATVYDGAIHILGGNNPRNHYKWNGSAWSYVSTIPMDCNKGCSLVYDNKLHLFFNDTDTSPHHYVWDGNTWNEDVKPLSEHGTQGTVFNNKIMLLGRFYSSFIEPLNCVKDITITT